MAETESVKTLREAGEGLKSILERVADFFDIFDLSFIVSGAATTAALLFWGWRAGVQPPPLPRGWIAGLVLVVVCYIVGLICFAMGRWIRMGWRSRKAEIQFHTRLVKVLSGHGLLQEPPFAEYLARHEERGDWRLYVRMWAELRSSSDLAASFSLLRRYWVMAASYDGVTIALLVWAGVVVSCGLGFGGARRIDTSLALPGTLILLIAAVACSREAGRYVKYQVEELVASIAAARAREDLHRGGQ
jgi:hypothetical protein